jgi:hypothetical protein
VRHPCDLLSTPCSECLVPPGACPVLLTPCVACLLLLRTARVDAVDYSAPLWLRLAAGSVCGVGGVATAALFSAALGDATWSVSTGIGVCMAAGVYELGRPSRLSVGEAAALEAQWQDFGECARLHGPVWGEGGGGSELAVLLNGIARRRAWCQPAVFAACADPCVCLVDCCKQTVQVRTATSCQLSYAPH